LWGGSSKPPPRLFLFAIVIAQYRRIHRDVAAALIADAGRLSVDAAIALFSAPA
jgi:hypothetical protein